MKRARLLPALLLSVIVALAGCASPALHPVLPPGSLAVVPVQYPPHADFNIYARGKGSAAGELGATGLAGGAAIGAVAGLETGVFAPVFVPYLALAGALVGAAVGGTEGLLHGVSGKDAARIAAVAQQAVGEMGMHQEIARQIVALARQEGREAELVADAGPARPGTQPDYSALRHRHVAVLEVGVESVRMMALRHDPPRMALEMDMQARVVCLQTACTPWQRRFTWSGAPHSIAQWSSGRADLLRAEFARGYQTLARYAQENVYPAPP